VSTQYDVFEILPGSAPRWIGAAANLQHGGKKAARFSSRSIRSEVLHPRILLRLSDSCKRELGARTVQGKSATAVSTEGGSPWRDLVCLSGGMTGSHIG
jgi:hypothetical protein